MKRLDAMERVQRRGFVIDEGSDMDEKEEAQINDGAIAELIGEY